MKVAFVGKGGSGKTTLSALFAIYLSKSSSVMAIDADINQHLAVSLGAIPRQILGIPKLGAEADHLKKYLRGHNPFINEGKMIKTTPPGQGSKLIRVGECNPIYDYFARNINGIRFLATGTFAEDELGLKCYHSKLGSVELLLSHLIDDSNEYVVVDMTAGADAFAGGMFMKFDVTFLVVEPTIKSLAVYEQYKNYSQGYDINLKVIGNKIETPQDVDFLKQYVKTDLVAVFDHSNYVRAQEKGNRQPINQLEQKNLSALKRIKKIVDFTKKDWSKFYEQQVELHKRTALSWANKDLGEDLLQQIDPQFSLANAAEILLKAPRD